MASVSGVRSPDTDFGSNAFSRSQKMPELFKFIEHLKPHIPPEGIAASTKDEVWLMDNIAFRGGPGDEWTAEFVAAYFHRNPDASGKITAAIELLMRELGYADNDEPTKEIMRERLGPFIRTIASNMTVDIVFEPNHKGGGQLHLGPGDGNGISSQIFNCPVVDPDTGKPPLPGSGPLTVRVAPAQAESASQVSPTSILEEGRMFLAEDGGWAFISDLDDTAKISCVNDHHKLIQNTFAHPPQSSPGCPELYKAIHDAITTQQHPSPFFYISASPYNLYPFLRKFVKNSNYPDGMIILRDMSWHDIHSWYSRHEDSFLHSVPVKNYKYDRFIKVASWLPNTTFVCFGDSTESDPEAYAAFYWALEKLRDASTVVPSSVTLPPGPQAQTTGTLESKGVKTGRVARIYIRKVVGVNPKLEEKLNGSERFEKAFENIPKTVWKVFEDGKELMGDIAQIKEERAAISRKHAEEQATGGSTPHQHLQDAHSANPQAGQTLPQKLMNDFRNLLKR